MRLTLHLGAGSPRGVLLGDLAAVLGRSAALGVPGGRAGGMPEGGENLAASSAAGEEGSSEEVRVREGFKAELRGHGFIPLSVGLALPVGTELCVDRNNAARYSRHKAREGGFVTVKVAAPADRRLHLRHQRIRPRNLQSRPSDLRHQDE